MSSQPWTMRVTAKPMAKIRSARATVASEIVTSPTLKPKNAARTELRRSAESTPQGASASMIAAMMRTIRPMPLARSAICWRERRRRPVLAWRMVAIRVSPPSAPVVNSSPNDTATSSVAKMSPIQTS